MKDTDMMRYLGELVRSQLEKRKPAPIPEGLSIDEIKDVARRAHMNYMFLAALLKLDKEELDISEVQLDELKGLVSRSMIKTLAQVCAIRELDEKLEANKVRYHILKGSKLKFIYPTPELREMSDIDIMVYESSMEKADHVVTGIGYQKNHDVKHHAVYQKKPWIVLEMHWDLYDKNVDQDQYMYFSDTQRAEKVSGHEYKYDFNKEDFYVYMIAHMAKHFYEQGCGIRNLVDIYIYQETYKQELNKNAIERELAKCGLVDFEKNMKELAYIWIEDKPCDQMNLNLFDYMLDCGIYGKAENGVWGVMAKAQKHEKTTRFQYYFPSLDYMKEYYPWLEKAPVLLPIGWCMRACYGIAHKDARERTKQVTEIDDKKMRQMSEMYRRLKLNFRKV